MTKNLTLLVADDDPIHRHMLATVLKDWGYEIIEAEDGEMAINLCEKSAPDLALVDVRMPRKNGLEALAGIKQLHPDLPVVIMTAYSEIPDAVEAIRKGAWDYLTKPLDFDKLKITLRNAFTQLGLIRENASLAASLENKGGEKNLLGNSPAMTEVGDLIRAIAPTEATVLISGESGTGKEVAAKAIHQASKHASGPFVAVNCGALTESLLASELFGHEKGAFTGADKKHPGLFLEAGEGSIFLDEIGEMSPAMQVKMLRVLQEREVLSVGGKKPTPFKCRVIAATNRDLAKEVEEGRFRQDLYYRLNVVTLHMPPLRDRTDDIPALARKFAERFAKMNCKIFDGFSAEAMEYLAAYNWLGNVRELENVMERAIILMAGRQIGLRELPERIITAAKEKSAGNRTPLVDDKPGGTAMQPGGESPELAAVQFDTGISGSMPTLEEVEREVILQTLKKFGNNKTETAKALGITRKTLHAKLNRYRGTEDGK